MDTFGEFLAMGGYADFIWPAYLVAAAVLAGLVASSLHQLRRNERLLGQLRQLRRGGPEDDVAEISGGAP